MTTFRVDDYAGTDSQKLAAACTAALKAIPSEVILPPRELQLTAKQNVRLGVSVRGQEGSSIFLDYPGATAQAGNSPYGLNMQIYNSAAEASSELSDFSIRARPTGYYRLLTALDAWNVTYRNLTFGVCGQSFLELRNTRAALVDGCEGAYGGDNSYDRGTSKYKIALVGCEGVTISGCVLGNPADDHNQSYVTVNASHSVHVVDSTFYGSQTYCLNTHGTGSTGVVFERNTLMPGPNAYYGAVLVGNETWGPDLGVTVRDNIMVGDGRFLQVRAGSEVFMSGNTVPACNELIGFGPGGGTVHVTGGGA